MTKKEMIEMLKNELDIMESQNRINEDTIDILEERIAQLNREIHRTPNLSNEKIKEIRDMMLGAEPKEPLFYQNGNLEYTQESCDNGYVVESIPFQYNKEILFKQLEAL